MTPGATTSEGESVRSFREKVAHLPADQRERVGPLVRAIPPSLRYGPVFQRTLWELRKARTVPSWAAQERGRRLEPLLDQAAETDYYGSEPGYEALRERGVGAFERLSRLPILTREQLSKHSLRMLTVPESGVQMTATSGTSGDPILFHLDRQRGAAEWAYVFDAWHRATGYELDDWRLFLRGAADLPGGADHYLQRATGELVLRVQALAPERIQEQWGWVRDRGIRYLHGYPSALSYMAKLVEEQLPDDEWRHQIRGVLAVSEEFTPGQQQTFERMFPNAGISNFYGLSERTCFASMDPDGTFHAEPLYGITELLGEDGLPVEVGQRGRLVTTSLMIKGQPFLRYDTGDSAERVGRDAWGQPTFRAISSRRGREGLVRADGSLFPTTSLNVHGHQFLCIRRFRFRQDVPGRVTLRVEPTADAAPEELEEFYQAMSRRTAGQVELGFELVEHLEIPPNGKDRIVDQNIAGVSGTWA